MDRPPQIRVTKLDAARRQLRTAIELWAADGDPVSIHSLAFAAHQIVHDLKHAPSRADKGPPMLLDNPFVRPEMKSEFVNIVKRDANFFKHADNRIKRRGRKEPMVMEIDFSPETNELFIVITIDGLKHLVKDLTEIEVAFYTWYSIHRPDLLNDAWREALKNIVSTETMTSFRSMDKRAFLEYAIHLIRRNQ